MNDVYRTPGSNLEEDGVDDLPKKRWKVFFWIVLVLEIFSVISMFFESETNLYEIAAEITFYTLVLIGLFGFAYKIRIFKVTLWRVFFPLVLVYDAYSIATMEYGAIEYENEILLLIIVTAIFILPLLLFQYLALAKYAFKSESLWK